MPLARAALRKLSLMHGLPQSKQKVLPQRHWM
jgi:hypothetical protein